MWCTGIKKGEYEKGEYKVIEILVRFSIIIVIDVSTNRNFYLQS